MPKITVDGKQIEAKDKQVVLQAILDAGLFLPHYCYHPGLSIPASCRVCLVEIEGIPKLVPSCQTQVRDGMVVHTQSPKSVANQKQVVEYLLLSHPLDCPVCDKAGECLLQDYSFQYGRSESRFEEDKNKKPKKDVGKNILLYNDRCIMCTRCVRFTREISGESELYIDGRGAKEEIDIFPGKPLDNKLSGNVVDLCPVGALLDKDFLFKQRVWFLQRAASVSPVDAGGENIWLEFNEGRVYRIKPRYNAEVNTWWISDDTRHSYHITDDANRLRSAVTVQHGAQGAVDYDAAIDAALAGLRKIAAQSGQGSLYAVLSPMMACEEAWLLSQAIRALDPKAVLVLGPVPTTGEDEVFYNSQTKQETFRIKAEKVPNAAGIRRVMQLLGGPTASFEELTRGTGEAVKALQGGWIVGGYHSAWLPKTLPAVFEKGFKVVQDILPSSISSSADVLLPAATWAEKEGTWENFNNRLQAFMAGVTPAEGTRREGDVYLKLLGRSGLYNAAEIRSEMGGVFADVTIPDAQVNEPAFEFSEL